MIGWEGKMRKSALFISSVVFVVLSSLPASSAEPDQAILGTWQGPYAKNCKAVRELTTEDFMIINRKTIEGYEGSCSITKFAKNGKNYSIEKLCEAEGIVSRDKMTIKVINSNHIQVDGDKLYERCQ